jgi:zinc transport system substrate-binding protein
MSRRLVVAAAAVLAGACVLGGCGDTAGSESGEAPQVVAALYPYAYVAERVAGHAAAVSNLTASGAEPHDLELSPQQVADLTEADVVIYQQGFQPAVDEAVGQDGDGRLIEVSAVAPLADTGAGPGDPHLWLDPTRLVPVASAVADQLAGVDPDGAAEYAANAGDLIAELRRLDADFRSGLADCERDVFVTSHAAFGYLALRYGLEMVPIAGITPDSEPSPARLAELRDLVDREGVTTVFAETLADPAIAETLATEAGVQVAVLDPVEGLGDDNEDADYFSLMRANLSALRKANGCR